MNILVRILAFVLKLMGFITLPFLILFSRYKKSHKVPPVKNPLLNIAVVDLAQKLRDKEVIKQGCRAARQLWLQSCRVHFSGDMNEFWVCWTPSEELKSNRFHFIQLNR